MEMRRTPLGSTALMRSRHGWMMWRVRPSRVMACACCVASACLRHVDMLPVASDP